MQNRNRSVYFLENNEEYIEQNKGKFSFNKKVNEIIAEHKEKNVKEKK